MNVKHTSPAITELYDKRVLAWALESQRKLKAAKILLIGCRGLGCDVTKSIMVSGIKSLTILDDGIVTEDEQIENVLVGAHSIGKNLAESVLTKAKAINSSVEVIADSESLDKKDEEYFKKFNIVIGTGLNSDEIIKVGDCCRSCNVKFMCSDIFGAFGYILSDLQEHEYFDESAVRVPRARRPPDEGNEQNPEPRPRRVRPKMKYPSLNDVLKHPDKERVKSFRNMYFYLMLVLTEFKYKYKRNVSYNNLQEDTDRMQRLWGELAKEYEVFPRMINAETCELMCGEVVPVCSMLGETLAQEAITAVMGKGRPLSNVFLMNPLTYSGRQLSLGMSDA